MPRRYHANNFSTTLAIGIGTGATSITLTSATGLPAIGTNEVYRLTLRYQGRMEIVEVTDDASSPTLTVTRAQESTTAQVFPVGSLVELRATANSLDRKQDQTATAGDVIDFGAAESFEIPNSATPTVNANGEIALDTSVADWSHGLIKYFGGEELFLVALPIAAATTPTNGYVVAYNATNDEFELVPQSGGGGGTPGGADTQVQFNDGGSFGGDAGLTYNKTTKVLSASAGISLGGNSTAAGYAEFKEDSDNGSNKITLTAPSSIASDKTITLPDTTGTIYVTGGTDVSLADGGTGASLADPNADRIMFWDDSAGTVEWLAVGAGLSISGTTITASGAVASVSIPKGRLTLATATPVMTSNQSAKTTIYYTPYIGNTVPIYDGSNFTDTVFTELSVSTSDTTKNPAAIGASKVNDWFIWSDSGTIRISHGPDWTDDTTRSAGTALTMVNGIYLNSVSITNGPAASRGTYVGTTRSNSSSQLDWILGGDASGGTAASLFVWNMYNRVLVSSMIRDTSTSGNAYTTTSFREWKGASNCRCSFVLGLSEDAIIAILTGFLSSTTSNATPLAMGIGMDSTTTPSGGNGYTWFNTTNTNYISNNASYSGYPGIGVHYVTPLQRGNTNGVFYGSSADGAQSAFITRILM